MYITCAQCGEKFKLTKVYHDENNLEGFYAYHEECGSSFDIDEKEILYRMFINDIPKMADFKILTKEEFLFSYSYLTEDEYDATELYYNWLTRNDDEP